MLRNIGKQSGKSLESVPTKKSKGTVGRINTWFHESTLQTASRLVLQGSSMCPTNRDRQTDILAYIGQ